MESPTGLRRHGRRGGGRWPAWLATASTLLLVGLLSQALAQDGAAEVGASTGVYTEAQAESGAALFARHCAACHGATLGGGMGSRLAPLESWWSGRSLASLVSFVRGNMPMTAPGSLAEDEYGDIVAFILASNGYPAGESPLPTEAEELQPIVFDEPPAG